MALAKKLHAKLATLESKLAEILQRDAGRLTDELQTDLYAIRSAIRGHMGLIKPLATPAAQPEAKATV